MSTRYAPRHLYAGMSQGELIAALRDAMEALERVDATVSATEQRRRFGDVLTAGEPWPSDLSNVQSGQLLKVTASGELTALPPTAPDTLIGLQFTGTPTVVSNTALKLQGDYTPSSESDTLWLVSKGDHYVEMARAVGAIRILRAPVTVVGDNPEALKFVSSGGITLAEFDTSGMILNLYSMGNINAPVADTLLGWLTVSNDFDLTKEFRPKWVTPAVIGATPQNNYATAGAWGLRLSASLPVNITGFAGGVEARHLCLVNVGANPITIEHQDPGGTSLAINRTITKTGLNVVLATDGIMFLVYDPTTQRWRHVA